jgi:hypothetical protein
MSNPDAGPLRPLVSINVPVPQRAPVEASPVEQRKAKLRRVTAEQAETLVLPTFASMTVCSNVTGIPFNVLKGAKEKGCAAFDSNGSGRVSLGPLIKFLFAEGSMPNVDWKDFYDERKGKLKDIELKEKEGEIVNKSDVVIALQKGMALVFSQMDTAFSLHLPAILKGKSETDIQQRLVAAVEGFKSALRTELAAYLVKAKKKSKTNEHRDISPAGADDLNVRQSHRRSGGNSRKSKTVQPDADGGHAQSDQGATGPGKRDRPGLRTGADVHGGDDRADDGCDGAQAPPQ